ncbi:N-acetyltransferase [Rhodobacter sp. SGA-6-6]|uniref:GNAT family N-acetyltransferase n=1 Tax=Rhodobacter sp. SGA-6-6 TaxID=2710882 RepID=UPI0013EBDA86|nr:N-acetyltransferase [Rhodobacter sp. SGA-6-6]NGM45279.1 N-acetyltransferase [Rhodobacter sp. SGA-6-6]
MILRSERPADAGAIRALTKAAFAGAPHASGTEAAIVDALRSDGALTLSLVAEDAQGIVAHLCFSPVRIGGRDCGWFGLGPVSVAPHRQGEGIGSRLIRDGLSRLRNMAANGCVVLGDPGFYARFGFAPAPGLTFDGAPPEYFLQGTFSGPTPSGLVTYHPAFYEN